MGNPDKRRQRRKEKVTQARRHKSQGLLTMLKEAGAPAQCYQFGDVDDDRMVVIMAIRPLRNHRSVVANFLIDYSCLGLKEAFIRTDITGEERRSILEDSPYGRPRPVKLDAAQAMVAAGIAWTRQNHFRLDERVQRACAVIDGIDAIRDPDLSKFGENGRLVYIGDVRDLRVKLQSESLEEFAARPDVDLFAQVDEAEWEGEDSEDEAEVGEEDDDARHLAALVVETVNSMTNAVIEWADINGVEPSPQIPRLSALAFYLLTHHLAMGVPLDQDQIVQRLPEQIDLEPEGVRAELRVALGQYQACGKAGLWKRAAPPPADH